MTAFPILSEVMPDGKAGAFDAPHEVQFMALNVRWFNAEHSLKADLPMEETDSGIASDVRRLQPSKADSLI